MGEVEKIMITGGAGFIGSHIADTLVQKGKRVLIVDNLSTGYKSNINPKAKFYQTDISDIGNLRKIFGKERPDKVIHAAAQIKVLFSVSNPVYDAKINIIGGLNILECCRKFKVKKIVYLSTGGALYGNPRYVPADEKHPIRPISPYGLSKYVLEQYLSLYKILYGIDFISLRFSNVYGPRDCIQSGHVIPLFIHSMINNKVPIITGDGTQGRDFIYVGDVVDAVMLSLNKNTKEKFLNIGTEKVISVNDLFNEIEDILKVQIKPKYVKERKGEVRQIYLNAKKAKEHLGWEAKTGLRDGLIETIKWFKEK
jgi:UDP-glucose 4-epimerase